VQRLNPTYTTSVGKMSAVTESSDAHEVIHVLFTLHPGMDALDFVGPLEVLSYAQHQHNDSGTGALDPPCFSFPSNPLTKLVASIHC
jgi:hypothetical protein